MPDMEITVPTPGSTLDNDAIRFEWDRNGVSSSELFLRVGSTFDSHDYYYRRLYGSASSDVATGLPINGSTVYVQLLYKTSSGWVAKDYTYTASSSGGVEVERITDEIYQEWLYDTTRDPYRVLLIELEHSGSIEESGGTADITLTVGMTNTSEYGWNYGSDAHQDELTAGFTGTGDDLTLTVVGYDVDFADEVQVLLNGSSLGYLSKGPNNSENGGDTFTVPAAQQVSGENIITFRQARVPGWTWGVTDILLSSDGVGVANTNTIYLASQPWIDPLTSQVYDDWLLSYPEIEDRLDDFSGIGDVDATDPLDQGWLNYNFRGYPCRWYYGDVAWFKEDFRQVASTLIDRIRRVDARHYRFDLMDAGQQLRRTFAPADRHTTISAKSTIEAMMSDAGYTQVTFRNVDYFLRDYKVDADITTDTLIVDLLREIAASIGAYVRITQAGVIEVFIPDTDGDPEWTLTDDDIAEGTVRLVDSTPIYGTVRIKLPDGSSVEDTTGVATGDLSEIHAIDTLLYQTAEYTEILDHYVEYFSVKHFVWEMGVFDFANLLQVGDYIAVDSEELTARGVVKRMRRSPMAAYTLLELEV